MNKKQVVRINENQLKQIVTESVKKVLKEALKEASINEWPYPKFDTERDRQINMNMFTTNSSVYWKSKHPEWSDEQCKKAAAISRGETSIGTNNGSKKSGYFGPCTSAHWKIRHPEWSDEKCEKAAKRYSKHFYGKE